MISFGGGWCFCTGKENHQGLARLDAVSRGRVAEGQLPLDAPSMGSVAEGQRPLDAPSMGRLAGGQRPLNTASRYDLTDLLHSTRAQHQVASSVPMSPNRSTTCFRGMILGPCSPPANWCLANTKGPRWALEYPPHTTFALLPAELLSKAQQTLNISLSLC